MLYVDTCVLLAEVHSAVAAAFLEEVPGVNYVGGRFAPDTDATTIRK